MPDREGDASQCERLTQGRKIAISSGGAFLTTPELWRLALLVALVGLPGAHSGGHSDSRQDPNSGRRECLQSALRKALAYDLNPELVTPHFFSFMLRSENSIHNYNHNSVSRTCGFLLSRSFKCSGEQHQLVLEFDSL